MSIYASPEYLRRCEKLGAIRSNVRFEAGQKIARGFADLGYEEFLLLPNNTLLSLFSGKLSDFPEEHLKFFFWVPTSEELLQELVKVVDIVSIEYFEQRTWKANLTKLKNNQSFAIAQDTLELALLEALITGLEQ